ncbi:MAG: T9SS type A sorting domain-containing protein [Bacteroidetes bacterium]|nr:T9SS type A sorting domain-containing protein [Bacteroidota bacterium]
MDEIENATNGAALKTYLSGLAPNLSQEVLESSIQSMSLLGSIGVYRILRDNAEAVNDSVISRFIVKYNELYTEMPEYMIDSIRMRMDSLTYRTFLYDTLSFHSEAKDYAAFNALSLIVKDTGDLDMNLYRQWLDSLGGSWAKCEKINSYLHEGKLDTVIQLLDSTALQISGEHDSISFSSFKNYLVDMIDWLTEDSSVMRMSATHIEALNEHAQADDYLPGSALARNLLNFFTDSSYFTPIRLPDEVLPFMGKRDMNESAQNPNPYVVKSLEQEDVPMLKIYPNPATEMVNIEMNPVCEGCTVEIIDVFGRLLLKEIIGEQYKITISTNEWATGMYLVKIIREGEKIKDGKFNVAK